MGPNSTFVVESIVRGLSIALVSTLCRCSNSTGPNVGTRVVRHVSDVTPRGVLPFRYCRVPGADGVAGRDSMLSGPHNRIAM